jgi:serine/threonine-protein kinase
MAQVFLAAVDGPEGFEKQCVVKKILPQFANDPSYEQMFVLEARVAAMMTHPNIVQVFEFSKIGGQFYLAMEYAKGPTVFKSMRAARRANLALGPQAAVEIGINMALALHYAHTFTRDGEALNLVHRDVSPDNMVVSSEGTVKLLDFGVVKTSMSPQNTVAGMVKGKWSYMSPEQVTSQPVDLRSDIFALGIVLFEASVGRRLFRGDSVAATVHAVTLAEIPKPSSIVPGFPLGLERIILKMLQRDPAARYQSAADVAAALDQFRATQAWGSGREVLAGLVKSLFPGEGSQPGTPGIPGSGVSDNDTTAHAEADGFDSGPGLASQPSTNSSVTFILGLGLLAVAVSAAFWFLLLS